MQFGFGVRILSKFEESQTIDGPDLSVMLDFTKLPLPDGVILRPLKVHRDGKLVETCKIALSRDPDFLRAAEKEGFFPMSYQEGEAQLELNRLILQSRAADNKDHQEIANLKADKVKMDIDTFNASRGETILSVLPKWHMREQPRHATRAAHKRRVLEFVNLHGNLPLALITKRQIVEFVEHVQSMKHKGRPLAATSVSNYLASVAALLAFATSSDLIPFNPSLGVKPPKDVRPKLSRSWQRFEKDEVSKLISIATEVWGSRRVQAYKNRPHLTSRKSDLITALHMLVWTGARPEEICQLRLVDLDLANLTLSITNDDSDSGSDLRVRFTKNENSVRVVPIHSKVAPIVQNHVSLLQTISNSMLLFPSFSPQLPTGRYARTISQEWTSHLRGKVTNNPRKVLYSLRHSWKAESLAVGMPEHVRLALMGHGGENTAAARYAGDAEWTAEKRKHLERMNCVIST
jgi:integrase